MVQIGFWWFDSPGPSVFGGCMLSHCLQVPQFHSFFTQSRHIMHVCVVHLPALTSQLGLVAAPHESAQTDGIDQWF